MYTDTTMLDKEKEETPIANLFITVTNILWITLNNKTLIKWNIIQCKNRKLTTCSKNIFDFHIVFFFYTSTHYSTHVGKYTSCGRVLWCVSSSVNVSLLLIRSSQARKGRRFVRSKAIDMYSIPRPQHADLIINLRRYRVPACLHI